MSRLKQVSVVRGQLERQEGQEKISAVLGNTGSCCDRRKMGDVAIGHALAIAHES